MKTRTKRIIAGAGAAALMAAATAFTTATAQAADVQADPSACSDTAPMVFSIPDGEDSYAGHIYFHDYNHSTGDDQDDSPPCKMAPTATLTESVTSWVSDARDPACQSNPA